MLEVSGLWQVFLLGFFGGVAAEAVRWYRVRDSPNLPSYLKSAFYWAITLIMILAGGGLACLYGTENVNGLLAANIGASAPLIISALASAAPPGTTPPGGAPRKKRRRELTLDFLSGR
jgi:hypothetical protein